MDLKEKYESPKDRRPRLVVVPWLGALLVAVAALVGCGGEEACGEEACDFGECDEAAGECVNADTCRVEADCLPGYTCRDHTCEIVDECGADEDCDVGVCEGGACVNPDQCTEDGDCLERTYCDDEGRCAYDPCNHLHCENGVCERGTGECVSRGSCRPRTESFDCAEGQKCADGECHDEEAYCEALECERGVCSFERGGCVNADDCGGDDRACREGFYCDGDDRCAENPCEAFDIECEEGGECVPEAGRCENAEPCQSDGDCRPGHVCVDQQCRLEEVACGDGRGDGGCDGRQTCEIADGSADCVEPERCETSFDCTGDRQCDGRSCGAPVECGDDPFEPNDTESDAVALTQVSGDGRVEATVCPSDRDVFSLDSAALFGGEEDGLLRVELEVAERARGLGELDVTLTAPDGATDSKSTGAMGAEGNLRFEREIEADEHGEYLIEIEGDDVNQAGVPYALSARRYAREALEVCEEAESIAPGTVITGHTDRPDGHRLAPTCGEFGAEAGTSVYALELEEAHEVTFELEAALSSTDLVMAVRGDCRETGEERGCVRQGTISDSTHWTGLLEAGRYYVSVQASEEETGGPFELSTSAIGLACSSHDDYCESSTVARRCVDGGGRFASVECDEGCDPFDGQCRSPTGDRCFDPQVVDATDPEDVDEYLVADQVELSQFDDALSLPKECKSNVHAETTGPEKIYRIDLGPGLGFEAEVDIDGTTPGWLYLLDDCTGSEQACLDVKGPSDDGQVASHLEYANTGDQEESIYLVVDSASSQSHETAEVDIQMREQECEPGEYSCVTQGAGADSNQSAQCGEQGLGVETEACENEWGCWEANGWCAVPNECDRAIDLTKKARAGDVDLLFDWLEYEDEHGEDLCGLDASDLDGDDAYFRLDMRRDERLEASLDLGGTTFDPALVLHDGCSADAQSCLQAERSEGDDVELSYDAQQDETVYLVADSDRNDAADRTRFQAKLMESCSDEGARRCIGEETLEVCRDGYWEPFGCTEDCNETSCDSPTGDNCHEVIDVTDEASQADGYTSSAELDEFADDFRNFTCHQFDSDADGSDRVFRVDLEDGETVEASVEPDSDFFHASVAISTDCWEAPDTCVAGESAEVADASYTASGEETVYVIADHPGDIDGFSVTIEVE
ncbi:MAG: hypothetical protein ACOCV2_00905 [Persicimonas sp.]